MIVPKLALNIDFFNFFMEELGNGHPQAVS
jgi:hypothetical protein